MTKNICTLLVLLSALNIYGQDIRLVKNTNPKAKELKHSLNTTKDSLVLECENKIIRVEIFNEDYEKIVVVENHQVQIPLMDLPAGNFVIETKLADKIIVMDLIKYNNSNEVSNSTTSLETFEVAEGNGMMLDERLRVIQQPPNQSIEFILTRSKAKQQTIKQHKFYWVVIKVNNKIGSSKTMRLVTQDVAERMIFKHKQELNSVSGKLNELSVWEVYNTAKFMEQQIVNPNFFYSLTSDLFNTTPYYSTLNNVANL